MVREIILGRKMKTWLKGLIIGLIPLFLVIILNLILAIKLTGLALFTFKFLSSFLYLFSFIFFIFSVLIGFVLHKNWRIKVLTFLIVILLFVLAVIYAYSGNPPSEEIETYKGIWTPALPMTVPMLFDLGQLKEDGVNTLSFGPTYDTDKKGVVHSSTPKWLTILFIQRAHRNGFGVFLVPNLWGPNFAGIENRTLFFEQATTIALEWAEIAEKYGVEMYAPSNEPTIMIDDKEAINQWAHEVAIKIREKYSGILVYKSSPSEWGYDNDYRRYDYVGLDIFPATGQTLEEFRNDLQINIENGLKFAERDGAKGVILSEVGVQVGVLEGPVSTTDKPFSLEYQKQAYEMFFEEGNNKVIGYVFCCWDGGVFLGPNNLPAEQVMKKWFNEKLK